MAGPRMKTEVMFSHRKHLFSKGPVNHSIFKNPGLAAWWMNCPFYAATFEQNGSHYWRFNPYVWLTWGGESLYWCSLKSIKITHFPRKTIVSLRFMSAKHMFFLRRKTYHHILFFFPLFLFPLVLSDGQGSEQDPENNELLAGAMAHRTKEQVEAVRNRLRLRLGATSSNKLVPWQRDLQQQCWFL